MCCCCNIIIRKKDDEFLSCKYGECATMYEADDDDDENKNM